MIALSVATVLTAAGIGAGPVGPPAGAVASGSAPAVATVVAVATVHTPGASLHIRRNTSTWHPLVDGLADGATVPVSCQLTGETIAGSTRTTALWLRVGDRGYVSDAFVTWRPARPALPWCDLPSHRPPSDHQAFVEWAAARAGPGRRDYLVPVSVTVAQAINESGWGRSALTTEGNAYFGIKCFGTPGPIATGCRPYLTRECDADDCFATTATFRVYQDPGRSFLDHGRFLAVNPRYQPAFDHVDDPDRFAREIHQAGYATDPAYSDKLIALMREHDLYRYDS